MKTVLYSIKKKKIWGLKTKASSLAATAKFKKTRELKAKASPLSAAAENFLKNISF